MSKEIDAKTKERNELKLEKEYSENSLKKNFNEFIRIKSSPEFNDLKPETQIYINDRLQDFENSNLLVDDYINNVKDLTDEKIKNIEEEIEKLKEEEKKK
jgi:hypothetical protein